MPARRRVSLRQMELLVEFAESHRDIALGRFPGGPQAVRVTREAWDSVAVQLNSVAEGTTKTGDQWRRIPSVDETAPADSGIVAPADPVISYPSTSTSLAPNLISSEPSTSSAPHPISSEPLMDVEWLEEEIPSPLGLQPELQTFAPPPPHSPETQPADTADMPVQSDEQPEVSREDSLRQKQELRELVPSASRSKGNPASQEDAKLNMEKCLIVSKVTRYEYEKYSHEDLSEGQLEKLLRKRGSDFDSMLTIHKRQKAFEENVAKSLKDMGLKVEMASRLTYNEDLINWCDVVVPCGGDGTFLLAASRVRDANKPVIGFNSSPKKSVGRLCLPTWCSNDVKGAFQALKEGRFRWMRRSRIRTTITCEPKLLETITPVDLHTLHYCRYPPVQNAIDITDSYNLNSRHITTNTRDKECPTPATKVLPFLALNEVFIGESVTSRVSLLRLQIDNGEWAHTKSSGLCVTTGTGSTSWHFSINCLRTHSVQELMKILSDDYGVELNTTLEKAREVTEKYNQKLMFAADSDQLAYSVREYITFEEWPTPRGLKVRDKATSVNVKSHCTDAGLVIDGSVSFPFNDGTEAILEIHPEDSLMTVQMDDLPK